MGSFPTNTLKFKVGKQELCKKFRAASATRDNDALAASLGMVNSKFYFAGYIRGAVVL